MRRKALGEPDLTLEALLDHGRTLEISEQQAGGIEQNAAGTVNTLHYNHKQQSDFKTTSRTSNTQFRNCGEKYLHQGVRPAKGKERRSCGKLNHYAKVCHSSIEKLTLPFKHNDPPIHKQRNKPQRVK